LPVASSKRAGGAAPSAQLICIIEKVRENRRLQRLRTKAVPGKHAEDGQCDIECNGSVTRNAIVFVSVIWVAAGALKRYSPSAVLVGDSMKIRAKFYALCMLVSLTGLSAAPLPAQDKPPDLKFRVGDTAPDFKLQYFDGSDLKDVKLSDYRGKKNVVLAFYIFAFTGG
jgi:hypothetical protein